MRNDLSDGMRIKVQRKNLSHAGPKDVIRESGIETSTRRWLRRVVSHFHIGSHSSIGLPSGSCKRANRPFGCFSGSTETLILPARSCSTIASSIPHAKIDHPVLPGIAKVFAVLWKRGKHGWPGLLRPWLLAVISRHEFDAEMFLVPLSRRCRILRAEEQTTDSSYTLHADLWQRTELSHSRWQRARACNHSVVTPTTVQLCPARRL